MFVFSWTISKIMQEMYDWIYAKILEFLSGFFTQMNGMGVEIFDISWIKILTDFLSLFAWALFATGLVVAIFECAIEMQNGNPALKETALNAIKGFFACSIFTTLPIALYKWAITLQDLMSREMIGNFVSSQVDFSIAGIANNLIGTDVLKVSSFFNIFLIIALGYCVIKVFFANVKRGGILIINIALGSLYMFSVPRGHMDGFIGWCKQVIALCFTAFMQTTLLMAGLITWNTHVLLAIGIMLAAGEVPRIAGQFGIDTSAKANWSNGVRNVQSTISMVRTFTSFGG